VRLAYSLQALAENARKRPLGEGERQQSGMDVQIALTKWGLGLLILLQIARKMAFKWALKKISKNS